jgi:hypothetical protein
MAHTKNYQQHSPETQEEAMKIAKATQRPGQTRDQTKLIAQGIQKGINQYKKHQKSKSRELNRKLKKASTLQNRQTKSEDQQNQPLIIYRQHWLPWALLALTWTGAGLFALFLS